MTLIRTAAPDDIKTLYSLTSGENHVKDNHYFERCLEEQNAGNREILVIFEGDDMAGYVQYQRKPGYQPFRSLQIPEIQDLYIAPNFRQNGLATKLIEYCQDKALAEGHDMIGIGVGLIASYGKAQRLYIKMGFEPDGAGLVYDRKSVSFGQVCPADDELCLMMVKRLK